MGTSTPRKYVNPYVKQYWLEILNDPTEEGVEGTWSDPVRFTEVNRMDHSADPAEYATKYVDYQSQAKIALRVDEGLEGQVDMLLPGAAQAELAKHECEIGVTARITRTMAADPTTGKAAPNDALIAKRCQGSLFVKPLGGDDPDKPMYIDFSFSRTDPWEVGTFNPDPEADEQTGKKVYFTAS